MNDLEPLEDITNILVFEDEPNIFTEEHAVELVETALHLMEEFMAENPSIASEPDFHDILLEEIKEMFYVQLEDHILESDYVEHDMNELLEDAFNIYITTFHSHINDTAKEKENEKEEPDLFALKIRHLRSIPQPVQRTPEWYLFRWNLITASNAWKAFETQATMNQLIYEKCQPLKTYDDTNECDIKEIKMVNTNTTLHWGQKYEPLSVMLYEHMFDSVVEDFGCIQHPTYKFIGASPDGIIVKSNTGRYGRMLEIKNIVNREITGIPKKEYWVQMQLQMEVCDLDECDFLETKFTEYPDFKSYKEDNVVERKGIIIHFHKMNGAPHYEYMPLNLVEEEEISEWEQDTIKKYESEPYNHSFLRYIYWKLDKLSCVLVTRNKEWFKNSVGQLENIWNIIEQERISGYEHRAPKRIKKDTTSFKQFSSPGDEICLLKLTKMDN